MNLKMKVSAMKKFLLLISLVCLNNISAQLYNDPPTYKNTSLDVTTNVASIAMGESFVANTKDHFSFFENPATLIDVNGLSVFYNNRSFGWMDNNDQSKFISLGGSTTFALGKIGFSYNAFTTGIYPVSHANPNDLGDDIKRTYHLSYAQNIWKNIAAGVSVKLFNHAFIQTGSSKFEITSSNTILFDFGLLYKITGLLNRREAKDRFNFGLSIQNFGTDYEEEYKYLFNEKIKFKIPRFARIGFSYEVNLLLGEQTNSNFDLLLTGEYRNLLNPTLHEEADVDYWGAGAEATLFKIVSFRIGNVITHENNILFDRAKSNWRYGIGLNFPAPMFGLALPMVIKFDFASIPINQLSFYDLSGKESKSKGSLPAYGISLSYNKSLN